MKWKDVRVGDFVALRGGLVWQVAEATRMREKIQIRVLRPDLENLPPIRLMDPEAEVALVKRGHTGQALDNFRAAGLIVAEVLSEPKLTEVER